MASIYGTESSTGWQLRLDYSYTQNISANTSTITATLYVYAGTSPSYNQNANGAYYIIQGTKTWNPYSYTSRGWKELGTKTWTENHNADGTLALTLSGFWCSDIQITMLVIIKLTNSFILEATATCIFPVAR